MALADEQQTGTPVDHTVWLPISPVPLISVQERQKLPGEFMLSH